MKDGQFPWQERKGQEEDLRRWDVRRRAPGGVQAQKSAGRGRYRDADAFLHLLIKHAGN